MPIIKNKHFTKEIIIEDYQRTKLKLGKDRLSRKEYIANGQYTRPNIEKMFGSWNNMKKEIGERPLVNKKLSKKEVSKMANTLFEKHGKLTAQIMREEGYAQSAVDRLFGSFGEMMKELSLPQEAIGRTRELTDEQLLNELVKIEEEFGYVNFSLLDEHSLIPFATFINRYKTFGDACILAGVRHLGKDTIARPFGQANSVLKEISDFLEEDTYHTEMTFDWLRNDATAVPFAVDAYFPENNLIVEYHGPYHYDELHYVNRINGVESFEETVRKDDLKREIIKSKNITFLEIYDYERDKVKKLLEESLDVK